MCRALIYLGRPAVLNDLLFRSDSSLINQTYMPKMLHMLDLAGFGMMAWDRSSYEPATPYRYTSPTLLIFDRNLKSFAQKTRRMRLDTCRGEQPVEFAGAELAERREDWQEGAHIEVGRRRAVASRSWPEQRGRGRCRDQLEDTRMSRPQPLRADRPEPPQRFQRSGAQRMDRGIEMAPVDEQRLDRACRPRARRSFATA
jgi:hypothetical protein